MVNYQKLFRISLSVAIISFIVFQTLIISTNVRYGVKYDITGDNSSIIVSPDQFHFELYSNYTQTITEFRYFALGSSSDGQSSNLDLLISNLDTDRSNVFSTSSLLDIEALNDVLIYQGLRYFSETLWTIGSKVTAVDNSSVRLESVMIQFDLNGEQLKRIPVPIESYDYSQPVQQGDFQRILINVNQINLQFMQITPFGNSIVTYQFAPPSFSSEEYSGYQNPSIVYGVNQYLWERFEADPFELEDSTDQKGLIKESHPSYHATPLNNLDDGFVKTINLISLRSSKEQVPLSSVTNNLVTQPIYERDDSYLLFNSEEVILPIHVSQFQDNETRIFYGFDVYNFSSAFFNMQNSLSLVFSILSAIIAIYSRLNFQNTNRSKTKKLSDI